MATLVFLESAGSTIRSSSLPAVTAARAIAALRSGPVIGVLVGKDLSGAASDAARYVDSVLCYDSPQLEHALAETYAPILAAAWRAAVPPPLSPPRHRLARTSCRARLPC